MPLSSWVKTHTSALWVVFPQCFISMADSSQTMAFLGHLDLPWRMCTASCGREKCTHKGSTRETLEEREICSWFSSLQSTSHSLPHCTLVKAQSRDTALQGLCLPSHLLDYLSRLLSQYFLCFPPVAFIAFYPTHTSAHAVLCPGPSRVKNPSFLYLISNA